MIVKELFTYPMKSTRGILMEEVNIQFSGFTNDRKVAVIDPKGKIITGREVPKLLNLMTSIDNGELVISGTSAENISFILPTGASAKTFKLFGNQVEGQLLDDSANAWISTYLNGDYRMIFLGKNLNAVMKKRGGKADENKHYSDSSPIHLINLKSLIFLNSKLKTKVDARNFRPNIVIDGDEPFEEDSWSEIKINDCRFRVQELTNRCIFTTIDPETANRDKGMQPLKQLAALRLKRAMRPSFGIGLVPLTEGKINKRATSHIIK